MADCSKTEVYISESKRMCDYYSDNNFGSCYEDCPFYPSFCLTTPSMKPEHAKEAINRVQKWSDEHPAPKTKTYADDFFEKFPKAPKEDGGIPMFCRASVYGDGSCDERYTGLGYENECIPCWNELYEESE